MTVRIPRPLADFIDSQVDGTGQIRNRSEYLQHWAAVGQLIDENAELTEAIDWALDQPVQKPEWDWKQFYGEVTISPQMLNDGPVQTHHFDPPVLAEEDLATAVPIPSDSVIVFTENGGAVYPDEVTAIQETQLEAMRNRVR